MDIRRHSGYLADDESFRRPQMGRSPLDWRCILRPPSRCQFRSRRSSTSTRTSKTFASPSQGKRKRQQNSSSNSSSNGGQCVNLANEFSEFVDFLADEEVLDSLQLIVEDAVQKLRDVTTQSGEPVFDLQEESCSSPDSESWSYSCSYSSVQSETRSQTATPSASSSEDDRGRRDARSGQLSKMRSNLCLLDKYIARLPKLREKRHQEVSAEIRSETFSEQSDDSYQYRQEHLHIWAKLAQSFDQLPRRDHFARLKTVIPSDFSTESLHKEITSVLKQRPHPCTLLHYSVGQEPFDALDFFEEHQIFTALQDIINQAVLRILEATMTDGIPFITFDAEGRPIMPWDLSEEEEESDSESSESGEESSETEEGKSEDGKKKRKGKKKEGHEKGKEKYTAPIPKSKRKSLGPEEQARKAKYVPPPLPKTKARGAPEETPGKPKYTPPPLPKPRKKQEAGQTESEASKTAALSRQMMISKDVKRARLQARPLPKESIIDFLIENAAKLILYKYNYEALLSEKLGLISVPVTKVLLEIMFGYKKVKGSGIRLSSQIDWTKVYDEIYKKRPPKPKPPKQDKKKKQQKKKGRQQKKANQEKTILFKPLDLPKGKVVIMNRGSEFVKTDTLETSKEPEIFEIVPPQFPKDPESDQGSAVERSPTQPSSQYLSSTQHKIRSEGASPPLGTPKRSLVSTRRPSITSHDNRGSAVPLPEVDLTSQMSETRAKKSLSHKLQYSEEGNKTVLPKISN